MQYTKDRFLGLGQTVRLEMKLKKNVPLRRVLTGKYFPVLTHTRVENIKLLHLALHAICAFYCRYVILTLSCTLNS